MELPPADFESAASACSAIRAKTVSRQELKKEGESIPESLSGNRGMVLAERGFCKPVLKVLPAKDGLCEKISSK